MESTGKRGKQNKSKISEQEQTPPTARKRLTLRRKNHDRKNAGVTVGGCCLPHSSDIAPILSLFSDISTSY